MKSSESFSKIGFLEGHEKLRHSPAFPRFTAESYCFLSIYFANQRQYYYRLINFFCRNVLVFFVEVLFCFKALVGVDFGDGYEWCFIENWVQIIGVKISAKPNNPSHDFHKTFFSISPLHPIEFNNTITTFHSSSRQDEKYFRFSSLSIFFAFLFERLKTL